MIYKRGQTFWYKFNWSIRQRDGTSKSFVVRRSARTKIAMEAEEVEHEHRRAIRLGEVHPLDPWPKPPAPEAPLLREFTTRFLEYARLHVKESSFEFYVGATARLLNYADLANAQISKINPELIARFAGSRKTVGVSVSAINGDLRTLRRLLRLAFEWEVIPRAPVVHALPGERTRDRVISFEEEQKYLASSGPNLRALTVLAVDTGMRPKSELFRLEWPQVHLEPSEMMPNGYIKVKEGKTQSAERVLPLTPRARETPEVMVPEMLFTATEAIGFVYGVTWNMLRRNIFNWKHEEVGNLEAKVKAFCAVPHLLRFLKDFIIFAEKEEELQKVILRQHQAEAVDKVVARALDKKRSRGLVWHTQGSGKTYTMIKAAELLFKANEAQKPTILLMIDRNELEDQLLKNLAAVGMANVAHADRIATLNKLLDEKGQDYRGIVVTMIHKFRDMPAKLNTRKNIFVLIDEAHRTTGGDLGNFLMAGLPNASFIGFTGTPVDKTVYGKGTFKTFGCEDDKGYLHKYSIAESIQDGTTLPLYYNLAPNQMLVPHEIMEKEFFSLAETEGIADIEELNKILDRAVNLKNFLKGKKRVTEVAKYVAEHYRQNVEPLGYKAFLVAVDREACTFYKEALDVTLPPEYSEIVFTGNNNDPPHLKKWHIDDKKEKQVRKNFIKVADFPKILIVTEKLLTGFDAPILYAMYLDKPMRDHTLLQAIARVNRPHENEQAEMVKPHGFVLDFVGIFDKLEKALAFDSDEINAIVKDIGLLKQLFKAKMESKTPPYLALVTRKFDDKDVDNLIEHFRDKGRREEFFKEYKEVEMLYEIISPDAFLRPFIEDYTTLSSIYAVVRNAYSKKVYIDKAFQKKTNDLVQKHIGVNQLQNISEFVKIDADTVELIKKQKGGEGTKVINLIKSIQKIAEENSGDPFLIAMAERAKAVLEFFEDRQTSTADALADLLQEIAKDEQRKKEQVAKGLDGLSYFVLCKLTDDGIPNPDAASKKVAAAFAKFPNWQRSEAELREVRQQVTFALYAEEDDMQKVTATVESLFTLLQKSFRP